MWHLIHKNFTFAFLLGWIRFCLIMLKFKQIKTIHFNLIIIRFLFYFHVTLLHAIMVCFIKTFKKYGNLLFGVEKLGEMCNPCLLKRYIEHSRCYTQDSSDL